MPGIADPIWLLPGSTVMHAIGGATLSTTHTVPNAAWARGVVLAWQAATFEASTGLQVTNPAVYTK